MLSPLIDRLKDPSKEVRSSAKAELSRLAESGTLSIEDAAALIVGATDAFPNTDGEWDDPSATLLYAARGIATDRDPAALLPVIESSFERLSKLSRQAALQIITLSPTREAAELYIRCLRAHGRNVTSVYLPAFKPAEGSEVGSVLFPSILTLVHDEFLVYGILGMLLDFRKADQVPADVARGSHEDIASVLGAAVAKARPFQRPSGLGWRDESPYSELRDLIGLAFDVAGYLDDESLLRQVDGAGDLLDPRLRRFRAITLLRRGVRVPDLELEWIATSPRDRFWLFEQMHELGFEDRLPAACRDQQLLAEGNMVDWLCFGTELGREPDEIVCFATESRSRSAGPRLISWMKKRTAVDYFFFRFRVTEDHWSTKNGWTVGMAGGYARNEQPTTRHDGGTFSKFQKWDEKSPAEHIADYLA